MFHVLAISSFNDTTLNHQRAPTLSLLGIMDMVFPASLCCWLCWANLWVYRLRKASAAPRTSLKLVPTTTQFFELVNIIWLFLLICVSILNDSCTVILFPCRGFCGPWLKLWQVASEWCHGTWVSVVRFHPLSEHMSSPRWRYSHIGNIKTPSLLDDLICKGPCFYRLAVFCCDTWLVHADQEPSRIIGNNSFPNLYEKPSWFTSHWIYNLLNPLRNKDN